MTHTLGTHFSKLLTNIQPPAERRNKAVELHPQVSDFLARHQEFATEYPHSRLAGSYAQHLTVGDVKDVDILIVTPGDPYKNDPTAREVLKQLHAVLRFLPEELGYSGEAEIERNRRSVHVYLKQEDFHFDVVPCITPDGLDKPMYVPDWGYKKWIESQPLGVVQRIQDLEAAHPGKFRNATKLLKHFRNTHMVYMQPKSYWLVALAINAVQTDAIDTSEPLAVVFHDLIEHIYLTFYPYYARADAVPKIKDPMLGHDVAWNWERHDFKAFMDRLSDGTGWSRRALDHADKDEAIKLWQRAFGPEFEADVDDYAKTLAASRAPGNAHASRSGMIFPSASAGMQSTPVPPTQFYGDE